MTADAFALVMACLPLAAYFMLLGMVRLIARPLVTTLGRDLGALSLAAIGLFAIGPLELFFPSAAAVRLGLKVWFLLLAIYGLTCVLIVFSLQQRLIVYGATVSELLEPLWRAAKRLDPAAELHQEHRQIWLPGLHIRLRVDGGGMVDTAQVVAFENQLSGVFWNRLLSGLRHEVQTLANDRQRGRPHWRGGVLMLLSGLFLLLIVMSVIWMEPTAVTDGFKQWFWR